MTTTSVLELKLMLELRNTQSILFRSTEIFQAASTC